MTKNKGKTNRTLRGIVIFVACVLVLQCAAMLFLTPSGLMSLYPYVLLLESEKITTGDANLGEYFPLHNDTEDAGLIILAVDEGVADSYRLASDYLQFLGKFTEISSVALYTSRNKVAAISEACVESDYDLFNRACNSQINSNFISNQMHSFLEKIYTMNSRLSPDKKFNINGILGMDELKDVVSQITTDLYMSVSGYKGDHTELLRATTAEEYVALFEKHYDSLKVALGSKFERHEERYRFLKNGTLEESTALQYLEKYSPPGEGAVFAVLPEHLCAEDSAFVELAEEVYGKVAVTRTVYYNCTTLANDAETPRNDGSFPGFADGIRIASAGALKDFRNYFSRISNSFGNSSLAERMYMIGEAGKNTFFIISGSGAITFGEEEEETVSVGTVNVAPG